MSKNIRFQQIINLLLQNLPIQFRGLVTSLAKPYIKLMTDNDIDIFIHTIKSYLEYIEGEEVDVADKT